MPNTTSAKKELRKSEARRVINRRAKSEIKKAIKTFVSISKEDKAKASVQLSTIYKKLDKAAKTNLWKKNKVNRTKSRLSKKLAV